MAEEIYFGYLNKVVSDIWVEKILTFVYRGIDEENIDKLMPLGEDKAKKRRGTRINY